MKVELGLRIALRSLVLAVACGAASAQTQIELTDAAEKGLVKADAELNAAYKQAMAALNEEQKALLKKSQVAWIKYRDLCSKSEASLYEGGSCQSMIDANAAKEVTIEKTQRLQAMLPDAVRKRKAALKKPDEQKAALKKADARLNKVYNDFMAYSNNKNMKEAAQAAEKAWLAYRDLCAAAEASLYDKEAAPVASDACVAELTVARVERLKNLFMETYHEEGEKTK